MTEEKTTESVDLNFDVAFQLAETFAKLFGTKGITAIKLIHFFLDKFEHLPAPFDRFNPYIHEVDAVLELFIEVNSLELPAKE